MLGASNALLNADHYGVYFKGMALWNGKVGIPFSFIIFGISEYLQLRFSSQVLRRHGDVFERTARGYYHAHGRADDTMNLGGIKVKYFALIFFPSLCCLNLVIYKCNERKMDASLA